MTKAWTLFVGVLLWLLGVGGVHAQVLTYYDTVASTGTIRDQSATALCQAKVADYNRNQTKPWTFHAATPVIQGYGYGYCEFMLEGTRSSAGQYWERVCYSSAPYFDPAKGCSSTPPAPPDPCKDKNEFIRRWDYPSNGSTVPPSNYNGCKIEVMKMLVCRREPSGMLYCMWLVRRTGEPATGPDTPGSSNTPDNPQLPPANSPPITPPPAPPGKSPCPEGTVHAGSAPDGAPVCMGQGSNPQNPPKAPPKIESEQKETLPDGSTKVTKTTTTTNADGSTTKQTDITVTKPDGTKETTQDRNTSTNTAGQPGRMDRPEQDNNNLCKQNPHLSICRESSVSGSCGEITCVGDAIQCATLRAAAAMQCKQKQDEDALKASPLNAKGQAAIDGTDTSNLPTPGKATVFNIGNSMQGAQGWLGQGSAFEDVTFTIQGHQVTVPLSKWSGYLVSLRYVMMIIASLISFRILGTAILKE